MGFRGIFGRKKSQAVRGDALTALAAARITLQGELGLKPDEVAALVFKPVETNPFDFADSDVESLVRAAARSSGSEVERKTDSFGFEWLIVHNWNFDNLVTAIHEASSELARQGFGENLLAAAFRFQGSAPEPVYWIYGFKTGTFWPFVPTGEEQKRDNTAELELKEKLDGELPIERDLSRWFGLFDAPI